MDTDGYPDDIELLDLPICINSYLLIRLYALCHRDARPFYKLIREYFNQIPIWELTYIILAARMVLTEREYEQLIEMIFEH